MQAKGNSKQLWWFIGLSLLGHLLVFGIMTRGIVTTSERAHKKPEINSIKAELVFIPPPPVEQQTTQPEPLQEVPASEAPAPEKTVESEVAVPENVQSKAPPETNQPVPAEPVPPVEAAPPPQEQIITGGLKDNRYGVSSKDIARQHLGNIMDQQQQRLAEQSARQYRQNQISPVIPKPPEQPFLTETEKLMKEASVRVDCSSTVNKSIATLSKIVGGVLDCSKGPEVSSFIENRINKVPASYRFETTQQRERNRETPQNP